MTTNPLALEDIPLTPSMPNQDKTVLGRSESSDLRVLLIKSGDLNYLKGERETCVEQGTRHGLEREISSETPVTWIRPLAWHLNIVSVFQMKKVALHSDFLSLTLESITSTRSVVSSDENDKCFANTRKKLKCHCLARLSRKTNWINRTLWRCKLKHPVQ